LRLFLFQALVAFAAVLIVSAVVFRSRRAVETLRFLRTVAWAYVIVIVVIGIWRLWQQGGI
jgi:multisubunit Na+/H+ antiporter MnhB subunit